MLDLATGNPVRPFSAAAIDEMGDPELDALPFGVVGLDEDGVILRYNLYESRLARLDRNQVLGRTFFGDVAPCTAVEAFYGRFQRIVAAGAEAQTETFSFVFDFKFGAQAVSVEIVPMHEMGRYYLLIKRQEVRPPRAINDPPEGGFAVLQRELAPEEARAGVRRDAIEQRVLEIPWSVLAALRATCDRLAPDSWELFCSEWGVQWGRRLAIDLETAALEEHGATLRELSMRDVSELIAATLARQGWGRPTFDFSAAREGLLVVELARSALAEAAPSWQPTASRPTQPMACHLVAGCMSALLTSLAQRRLVVREVSCCAAGATSCAFVVVASPRRATLDAALQKGLRGVEAVRAVLLRAPTTREES